MTNILIGIFIGIVICTIILGIIIVLMNKDESPQINNRCNTIINMHDDEYTGMHLDEDENIIAFISCNPNNIKSADFYYSVMTNKQIVTIIYNDGEKERAYKTFITELKITYENTLRIYYTVTK